MVEALEEVAIGRGRPFLGICVGMQLMASVGREHGRHAGLGWIPGAVEALEPTDPGSRFPYKALIPHMGWNSLEFSAPEHPVLAGLAQDTYVYFVHSYHFRPKEPRYLLARTDYGGPVAAVVGRDNLIGTQFHPEKSQAAGLAIIGNFLRWRP
jgi:glutamine amidotransferase